MAGYACSSRITYSLFSYLLDLGLFFFCYIIKKLEQILSINIIKTFVDSFLKENIQFFKFIVNLDKRYKKLLANDGEYGKLVKFPRLYHTSKRKAVVSLIYGRTLTARINQYETLITT